VVFVVLAIITWGAALLAYPIMWFLMPDATAAGEPPHHANPVQRP
jgi:phage shock protein PspC (stress-responsive transcriptional regulator)